MKAILSLLWTLCIPLVYFAQVPTITDPVPRQGLGFLMDTRGLSLSPADDPLVVMVRIDTGGHCHDPKVIKAGKEGSEAAFLQYLDRLEFLPGRWGAEAVERDVYLAFSSAPDADLKVEGVPPYVLPNELPLYHFYPGMTGWETEKDAYLQYLHLHRHLFPPVGYEESDEEGNFTETIDFSKLTFDYESPSVDEFFTGEPPTVLNIEAFHRSIRLPRFILEAFSGGRVIVRILIDPLGYPVRWVTIRNGGHPTVGEAATAYLDRLRFTPGKLRGEPQYSWVTLPVRIETHR